MKIILFFEEIGKEDIKLAGGKGANLGEMKKESFPVPDGFCITSNAFEQYMKFNKLNPYEEQSQDWTQFQRAVNNGDMPLNIEQEILKAYQTLGENCRVAVRSSATAEDLPDASFAGQQETFLNIQGKFRLLDAVKACYASLYGKRAISYRHETGFDNEKVLISVVVQAMVNSDVSGVVFSVDPISQDHNHMLINASYGLGESVVSGYVTPDTYLCDKQSNTVLSRTLGQKETMIVYKEGSGTNTIQTSQEQRRAYCMEDKAIKELVALCVKIEAHYGCPQDIEWAMEDGKLYILQSRAITTLTENISATHMQKKQKNSAAERALMNNLIEHCPHAIYPLDYEPYRIVSDAKSEVFAQLGIVTAEELEMDADGQLKLVSKGIHITPKVFGIPRTTKQFLNFTYNQEKTKTGFQSIRGMLQSIEQLNLRSLSDLQLTEMLDNLMNASYKVAHIRFRYNIFPSVILSKLLKRKLIKIEKGLTEYDLLIDLPYFTVRMNDALSHLSALATSNDLLRQIIMNGSADTKAWEAYPEFREAYNDFLRCYGWKSTASYIAFSATSWNENCNLLFDVLKLSMKSELSKAQTNKYKSILQKINTTFHPQTANKMINQVEQIRAYHINREESLYLLETCFGLSRRIVYEIEKLFPSVFPQRNDILFLTVDEVKGLIWKEQEKACQLAMERRKKMRIYNDALWNDIEISAKGNETGVLKGSSGNRGNAKAKARVILTMDEFHLMQPGEVLVCRYTDPSWTPLFPMAAAVVSDTGGPLSHSAIVAREYGIPAVLGCGDATKRIKDGDIVLVDGDNGKVLMSE